MVGQQILDLLIGVRIPGGQPIKSTGITLTETQSPRHVGRHRRSLRRLGHRRHSFARHRSGAACCRHLSGFGRADVRLSPPPRDRLSYGLCHRGWLHHGADGARSAHAACSRGWLSWCCPRYSGRGYDLESGAGPSLVSSRAHRHRAAHRLVGRQDSPHAVTFQPTLVEYHGLVAVG